jgi:predicted short-subunit dehydrogenase-like oxidoreductase (DUF2520 family)
VVGAGRVGVAFAEALVAAGVDVCGVVARSERSVARANARLPGVPVAGVDAVAARAGVLLVAVPDDVLPAVGPALPVRADLVLVHTSGRLGLGVFGDAARLRAAAHPAMTFADSPDDAHRLAGVAFGVTADAGALPVVASLVAAVGGRIVPVADVDRELYHAALANAANHLVGLVAESADWLTAAGIEDPGGVLGPLALTALERSLAVGDAALTGPVARGDAATVAAHVAALRSAGVAPEGVAAYVAMAKLVAARAHRAGLLDDGGLAAVLEALPPVP